jgi:hypothetical protein
MQLSCKKWLGIAGGLAMLAMTAGAFAAAPQSDDFKNGLASFWKAKQTTGATTFPAPSYSVNNGRLSLTSADNDIWTTTYEPYLVYQDGITGNFTIQLKIQSLPQNSDWGSVGLFIAQSAPDKITDTTAGTDIPTWWALGATRDYGIQSKGGGQGASINTTIANGLQPPYWVRMDREDSLISIYYSTDGGATWIPAGDPVDMGAQTVNQFEDPLVVGIFDQTHNGTNLGTAIVSNFEGGTLDQAGKLPGDPAAPAVVTGAATDGQGNPLAAGVNVYATDANGNVYTTRVDASGNYTMYLDPGTYTFGGNPAQYDNSVAKPVTFTAGQSATNDITLTPFPYLDLNTLTNATNTPPDSVRAWGDVAGIILPGSFDPANPTFDDQNFIDVDWPADLNGNPVPTTTWFWYRIQFKIPASFQSNQGKAVLLNNFNVDDSDLTFVNGHFVGQTMWAWDTVRSYLVPNEFLNWDGSENTIAILGEQGTGGAGSQNSAAHLQTAPAGAGYVYGKVVTETGAGAGGFTVTLTPSSGTALTATSSAVDGSYRFVGIPAGAYSLSVTGLAKSLPAATNVTVTNGVTTSVPDLKITGTGIGPADLAAADVTKLTGQDMGAETGGSLTASGGNVEIDAEGADIWDVADAFYYATLPNKVSGDFTAAVKINNVAEGASEWSKAGIMARTTLDAGAQNVFALASFLHGVQLQWRPTADAATSGDGSDNWFQLGEYLILSRSGDTFSVYRSLDGSTAELLAKQDVPGFPKDLLLGLAATSHAAGSIEVAKFSDFKVSNTAFAPTTGGGATVKPGDLNGDGNVNVQDATLSLRIAVGLLTPTDAQKAAGDVNNDGKWNVQDATLILRAAVGLGTLS